MEKKCRQYLLSSEKKLDFVYYEDADASYPLHTHAEHDTLGIVLEGALVLETETGSYVCEAQNMFTVPMDMAHAIHTLNGSRYTMLAACIHIAYASTQKVSELGSKIADGLEALSGKGALLKTYAPLLQDGLTLLAESRLQRLEKERCLKGLKAGLLKVPELPFTIEEMSEKVCISPFHLIRQFKKEMGLTPHQFQLQCRIRKAQKLLLERKTVTEVAFEMGFCDQSHFDKSFKKLVGMSPAAYQSIACLAESGEKLGKEK